MKHKLETFVNFPIHDFDLTKYVANKNNSSRQVYELYALTNHYGGMGSGHYTAYIKVRIIYLFIILYLALIFFFVLCSLLMRTGGITLMIVIYRELTKMI